MAKNPQTIALIREGKTPPDRRVPLTPDQCVAFENSFPQTKLIVQSSPIRCYKDEEYASKGIEVLDDISHADVLIGVKEVPIDQLIPDKTYFFFSHTYKKQEYNRDLLRVILDKNIRLIDYELLKNGKGLRLIGFGRYAGVVGAYNALRAWGMLTGEYSLKSANQCFDRKEVNQELQKVSLPSDFKLVMTGGGRVARGITEILQSIQLRKVLPNDFLIGSFNQAVYTALTVQHYVRSLDGRSFFNQDFYSNPTAFESAFLPFAHAADAFVAGHFWKGGSPPFFTREEAKDKEFQLKLVADISCDIDGPIASTIRPSTIADPFYSYEPQDEIEVPFGQEGSIAVMAVDNLPGELPRDASEDFGNELLEHILPNLFNGDSEGVLYRATETENGQLTKNFEYLKNYVNGEK